MQISEYRELIKGQTGDRVMSRKEPEGNKKVKNAHKVVSATGEKYDSELEYAFKLFLVENKVSFQEKKPIKLANEIKNINGNFRSMNMIPDFTIEELNLAIDTKGTPTDRFREKFRILNMIIENPPIYIFVRNKKKFLDALIFIRQLKEGILNRDLLESMSYETVFKKRSSFKYKSKKK